MNVGNAAGTWLNLPRSVTETRLGCREAHRALSRRSEGVARTQYDLIGLGKDTVQALGEHVVEPGILTKISFFFHQEPHWESRTSSRTSSKIKILGKTSLRFSLRFSMRKKSSLPKILILWGSWWDSWFFMRFLMRLLILNEILAQELIEI